MKINPLKRLRLERGIKQYELAQMTGLSESQLSKMETDRIVPNPLELNLLAQAFKVSFQELDKEFNPIHCRGHCTA